MALLTRIKDVKSNSIFSNFKRFYFQNHTPRLLTNYTSQKPNLDYYHCFRFTNAPKNQSFYPKHEGFLDSRVRFFAAPVQVVKKKEEEKSLNRPRLNDEITAETVRLVTNDGHFVVSKREAQHRAEELDVDLVEVDARATPPVCKLMDYNCVMYKKHVRGKEKAKLKGVVSLRKSAPKEVRISAKAEHKDIKIKMDTVRKLMDRGYRVKCTALAADGRDVGGVLAQMTALIKDVAFVEFGPKVDEKNGYIIVRHIKFGPTKKGNKSSKSSAPTNTETKTKSSADESEESGMDDDNNDDDEDSNVDLGDLVKVPLKSQQGGSSSSSSKATTFRQPQAPNVGPISQPENRYAKKPSNNTSPVRGPVRPPYRGDTQPPPGFPARDRRQARGDGFSSGDSSPHQNENPRGGIPNRSPSFTSNNSSQSQTFNPFSGAKPNARNFDNVNPPTSKFGGGAAGDNKKWGTFSGENSVRGRKG